MTPRPCKGRPVVPIGHKTAIDSEEAIWIHCGQMLHCCRANNGPAMLNCNEAWKYDNSTIRIASKCGNALGNFDRIAHTGRYQPKAERWCRRLDRPQIWSP